MAVTRFREEVPAAAHLHAAHGSCEVAHQEVEQHENDVDVVALCDVDRGIDVAHDVLVETQRPSALAEANTCAAITEEEPPNALHSRPGERLERPIQLGTFPGLADAAVGPPCVAAEIDTVMKPGQVGADKKWRRRRICIKG